MYSSEPVIRVRNLSKCYEIYDSPRNRLKQFIYPLLRRLLRMPTKNYFRDFWALKDVNFEVRQGETIGIIGRNGSGKSTLLQIICGTLSPTEGTVETRGRIAALLELGSGFNPEFTGRENIFLNASVLGLSNEQISERLPKIIEFADIGEFIDQPVKTYSSGMMVRLAFAVIAHVDADILIVDEALAVGDAIFTQKCMNFIRNFQKRGVLLFVSHDTNAVLSLCQRAIWLNSGRMVQKGVAKEVAEQYLKYTLQEIYGDTVGLTDAKDFPELHKTFSKENVVNEVNQYENKIRVQSENNKETRINNTLKVTNNIKSAQGWRTESAEIFELRFEAIEEKQKSVLEGGELVRIEIRAKAYQHLEQPIIGFLIRDRLGQDLFGENTNQCRDEGDSSVEAGQEIVAEFIFRMPMLPNGQYALMASIGNGDAFENVQHHYLHDAMILNISSSAVRYGLVGIPFEHKKLRVLK